MPSWTVESGLCNIYKLRDLSDTIVHSKIKIPYRKEPRINIDNLSIRHSVASDCYLIVAKAINLGMKSLGEFRVTTITVLHTPNY